MKSFKHKDYTVHIMNKKGCKLLVYERKKSLSFTIAGSKQIRFVLSFKGNKPAFYRCMGTKITSHVFTANTFNNFLKHNIQNDSKRRWLQNTMKIAIGNMVKKKFIQQGIKLPRFSCKKLSVFGIITLGTFNSSRLLVMNKVDNRNMDKIRNYFLIHVSSKVRHSKDYKQFVYNIFLSNNPSLRKLTGEAIKKEHYYLLVGAYCLRQLIPVEYFDELFKSSIFTENCTNLLGKNDIVKIRKLLKNYNPKRIRQLLLTDFMRMDLLDATNQYLARKDEIILPKNPKSIKELHDDISRQYRRLKVPYQELKKDELANKLDDQNVDNMTIQVAKSNHQLMEWGEQMNNCVAMYASSKSTILGIYKNEKLTYNIELKNMGIMQFLGKHNELPDKDDVIKIGNFINIKIKELAKEHSLPGKALETVAQQYT